jgi:hypothetical protein
LLAIPVLAVFACKIIVIQFISDCQVARGNNKIVVDIARALRQRSDRERLRVTKAQARATISNGKDFLRNVDGRGFIAKRYRDILTQIALDQGGADRLSECRLQLCRRFAAASVLAENLEAQLVQGEQIDLRDHALLSSTLVRLVERIGIDRVARDIVPDPLEYARERAQCQGEEKVETVEAVE